MMYEIVMSTAFKRDLKRMKKRGKDTTELEKVIDELSCGNTLAEKYKDHKLTGNLEGYKECHIEPDWLLIYKINGRELILHLLRTGSHDDLF